MTDAVKAVAQKILARTADQIGTHSTTCHEYHLACFAAFVMREMEAATASPAVDREALVKVLRDVHFDGSGCGTNGATACSNCYGPSPLSALEVVDCIIAALGARDVRDAQAEALEDAADDIEPLGYGATVTNILRMRAQAIRGARNEH